MKNFNQKSREEIAIKKAPLEFFVLIFIFIEVILFVNWAVDFSLWNSYIKQDNHISHDRFIFLALSAPILITPIMVISGYMAISRKLMHKKYSDFLVKVSLYGAVVIIFGVTPLFSIASGYYLEHLGYERCPSKERGAFASIRAFDYAKSPEYCPK